MTKKEELLAFIDTEITTQNILQVREQVLISSNSQVLENGDFGTKAFDTNKDHLVTLITDGFDDNLEGFVGTSPIKVKIISWLAI